MRVTVIGRKKTEHGYVAYCEQTEEREGQKHEGYKTFTCFCKFEPVICEKYEMSYYKKTGKNYIFE